MPPRGVESILQGKYGQVTRVGLGKSATAVEPRVSECLLKGAGGTSGKPRTSIFVTLEVSQAPMFELNNTADLKVPCKASTAR